MNSANDCKFLAGAVQHHKHAWHRSQHPRTVNLVPHFCKHLARLHGSRRNLGARAAARGTPGLPSLWCRAEKQHPTARLPCKVPSWSRSHHLLPGMTPVLEGPPKASQPWHASGHRWGHKGTWALADVSLRPQQKCWTVNQSNWIMTTTFPLLHFSISISLDWSLDGILDLFL